MAGVMGGADSAIAASNGDGGRSATIGTARSPIGRVGSVLSSFFRSFSTIARRFFMNHVTTNDSIETFRAKRSGFLRTLNMLGSTRTPPPVNQ